MKAPSVAAMGILIRYLLLAFIVFLASRLIRRLFQVPQPKQGPRTRSSPPPDSEDPYEVLGVTRGANKDEIKRAYREALAKYHPDKVDHLGQEIQSLAREKTRAINKAYESLK